MQRKALILVVFVVLLVIGAGLLVWEKDALAPASDEEVQMLPEDASPRGDQWFGIGTTTQGLTFYYPEPFPGRYVTSPEWPPLVELVANEYSCTEGDITAADGPLQGSKRVTINGREYCVTSSSEGAAGSTYTNYEYVTDQGSDFVVRIVFTIRKVQCMNYDEPARTACTSEQAPFNPDELADRIAKSIRMI